MASKLKLSSNELLEVDICVGGACATEESGVYVSCDSYQDGFSSFQHWKNNTESLNDTSSSCAGELDTDRLGDDEAQRGSIVDRLLVELYETYSGAGRKHADSWDSSTEASGSEAAILGRSSSASSFLLELQEKHTKKHQMNYLAQKAPEELCSIIQEVKYRTGLQSAQLIWQLKRRDRLCRKLQKNYDMVTACLQAVSQKRRKT